MKNLLPLGTVFLYPGTNEKVIIISRRTYSPENATIYDYICAYWPEGYASHEDCFVVNHEDIGEILHQGYSDAEDIEFLLKIRDYDEEFFKNAGRLTTEGG